MNQRLDEQGDGTDAGTDVGSRIEAWLEAELADTPDPRSRAVRPDVSRAPVGVAVKVGEAALHGRRLRARRRAAAAGAVATGLVAATVAAVAVLGSPTVTTAPRPPAAPSSTGQDRPGPAQTPDGTLVPVPGAGAVDVEYPSGAGTMTVVWPAPAFGTAWRVDRPEVLPVEQGALAFRDAVAPALGARPGAGQVAVYGLGDAATGYVLAFDVPVGTGSATATLVVSGGGLPDDEVDHDPCGAWPDGVKALGPVRPAHPEWCTVLEIADSLGRPSYIVHEAVPATGGLGPQRSVFTVRPDGLMVSLRFLARAADPRMPDWDALDRVVMELHYPLRP